jgi:hypothetical protein
VVMYMDVIYHEIKWRDGEGYSLEGFRMPFYRSKLLRAMTIFESAMSPD